MAALDLAARAHRGNVTGRLRGFLRRPCPVRPRTGSDPGRGWLGRA
jgi:hypothetical protein